MQVAGTDAPFLAWFAEGLVARGTRVARFEFPYRAKLRQSGKRRPLDKQPVPLGTWREAIDTFGRNHLVIGGKLMGGRTVSTVADMAQVKG
jgi:uncharacterized protein